MQQERKDVSPNAQRAPVPPLSEGLSPQAEEPVGSAGDDVQSRCLRDAYHATCDHYGQGPYRIVRSHHHLGPKKDALAGQPVAR